MQQKTLTEFSTTDRHPCPSCGQLFSSRKGLGIHHSNSHGETLLEHERRTRDGIECPVCGVAFDKWKGIRAHVGWKHPDSDILDAEVPPPAEEYIRSKWTSLTVSEMADHLDKSDRTIKKYIRGIDGIPSKEIRRRPVREFGVPLPWLLDTLHNTLDKSVNQISDEIGVHSDVISRWMDDKFGIPRRGHQEATQVRWDEEKAGRIESNRMHYGSPRSAYEVVKRSLNGVYWNDFRDTIQERDDHTCQLCGCEKEESDRRFDVHHIVPILAGGCNEPPLLMTLCQVCHQSSEKYTRDIFERVLTKFA